MASAPESESESESEESLESLELEAATVAFLAAEADAAALLLENRNEISLVRSKEYHSTSATRQNAGTERTGTHAFAFSSFHSFKITSNEG